MYIIQCVTFSTYPRGIFREESESDVGFSLIAVSDACLLNWFQKTWFFNGFSWFLQFFQFSIKTSTIVFPSYLDENSTKPMIFCDQNDRHEQIYIVRVFSAPLTCIGRAKGPWQARVTVEFCNENTSSTKFLSPRPPQSTVGKKQTIASCRGSSPLSTDVCPLFGSSRSPIVILRSRVMVQRWTEGSFIRVENEWK